MIHSTPLKNIRTSALMALVGLLAVSCGSYQSASYYDNDGIYGNRETRVITERAPRQVQQQRAPEGENTHADYFGQKADQYTDILESEIFTDVDSYASGVENDSIYDTGLTSYYTPDNDYAGNAGWGESPSNVNINIYDNGFNNWGWGGFGGGFGGGGFGGGGASGGW